MGEERPEALLKSALEKIVYFEARSEQLHNDLSSARAECDRLKVELAAAAQREIQLRRGMAELEVKVKRSHAEREELSRVNEALREERAGLLGKILEAARIHNAGANPDGAEPNFDLASFIAELRNEVLRARSGTGAASAPSSASARGTNEAPPKPTEAKAGASAVTGHALRLSSEGRLKVSEDQVLQLSGAARFPGRTEETLFGFSVRELSAPDPQARQRAAERLQALGNAAAAPAIATALHEETDPPTQVVLLRSFASFAKAEGASVVQPLLQSSVPEVRISALKALIEIDPSRTGPHVAAAMSDPDPAVRRRASLLALGLTGDAALKLGEQSLSDTSADVRRLGALVLGAGHGERARVLLLEALRDRDQKVRHAAAQSLSRIIGQDVSSVVNLDEAQRRREVRRLAQLPAQPARLTGALALRARQTSSVCEAVIPSHSGSEIGVGGSSARADPGSLPLTPALSREERGESEGPTESLCGSVLVEIRCGLRGRSLGELAATTGHSQQLVGLTCDLLVARGQVVRRGPKYFVA